MPPPGNPKSSGDQAAWFASELQPHEPALRAWLRLRFPDVGDVDDVVQESYLNVLRRRSTAPILHAKAYLFTAARHAVLRLFRRNRLYANTSTVDLPEWRLLDDSADVVADVIVREQDILVGDAIARLPARCRDVVSLRAIHGLSYAEIAERLSISEATVRVQVARGIRKCGEYLRDRGVDHSQ